MFVNFLYHGSLGFRVQEGFHVEGDLFVLDRFYDLYTVYCDRYGSGIHLNEYGYDDAAADDDLHAFQDPAVCTGRRLGTDHRAVGTDILLDS